MDEGGGTRREEGGSERRWSGAARGPGRGAGAVRGGTRPGAARGPGQRVVPGSRAQSEAGARGSHGGEMLGILSSYLLSFVLNVTCGGVE